MRLLITWGQDVPELRRNNIHAWLKSKSDSAMTTEQGLLAMQLTRRRKSLATAVS